MLEALWPKILPPDLKTLVFFFLLTLYFHFFQLQKEEQRKIDEAYDLNEDEQEEKEDLLTQGKLIFFCKNAKKFQNIF